MEAGGSEDQNQSRELCPLHLKTKTKLNQNKQNLKKIKIMKYNKFITKYKNPYVHKNKKKIKTETKLITNHEGLPCPLRTELGRERLNTFPFF